MQHRQLCLKWLEVAVDTQLGRSEAEFDRAQLLRDFLPVSTAANRLLVLKNDQVFHRTPLLVPLTFDKAAPKRVMRRFLWMPFTAFDRDEGKVELACPPSAAVEWAPAASSSNIVAHIAGKLAELGVQSLQDYVDPPFVREKLVGKGKQGGEGDENESGELAADEEQDGDVPPSWLFDGD